MCTHLAPDGRTHHDGPSRTCPVPVCENDRFDDAEYTPPPYRSQATPLRGDNGQRKDPT